MQKFNTIKIKYPKEVLLSLKEDKKEFEKEARFILAAKLYELGKLSSGKASELAELSRREFLMKLGNYKISPFQVDIDEVLEEAQT